MALIESVPVLRVRWLVHALSRNRLVRGSDRLEACAVLMVLAAALFVIPVAQRVGDDTTTVKWSFDSRMSYPMNMMLLFINMDKMLGKDMEESLGNLKRVLEK